MAGQQLDTLIFDIDDTLYPISSGFSDHRNGPIVAKFMVDELGFATEAEALALRTTMFQKYHSTLKGLKVASEEGLLPKPFELYSLGRYWAEHCDFAGHLAPNPALAEQLHELKDLGYNMCVFTNAPKAYGLKCLEQLGIKDAFPDANIYGVEDVMPHCKPEAAAFQKVLDGVGAKSPETCVMFEDSMKNIRTCKALGMRTVLVVGNDPNGAEARKAYASKGGDAPNTSDAAVDVVLSTCGTMAEAMPYLWRNVWK